MPPISIQHRTTNLQCNKKSVTQCPSVLVVWHSGSAQVSINVATLRLARLELGWVTVRGFESRIAPIQYLINYKPRTACILTLNVN